MTTQSAPQTRAGRKIGWKWTLAICSALLILFGVLSFTAALTKSATYDEPLHVVGGFVHRHFSDYRINFEDPALFGMWAALPLPNAAMYVDTRMQSWAMVPRNTDQQWPFVIYTLYRQPENWPDSTLAVVRSQFMFVGIGLGALAAWWSWKLGGGIAAIATAVFFALDPNLAAHASLVKNDVATGLLLLALGYSMWQFGKHGSLWRLGIVAAVCGAAVNTKFSGVLFGPITLLLLISRAMFTRGSWRVAGITLKSIWDRLAAVLVMTLLIGVVVWGMTWAVYGFRFAPMRDGALFDMDFRLQMAKSKELVAEIAKREKVGRLPTQEEFDAHTAGMTPRFAMTLDKHHVLPQAWLFGFLYTYATTLVRSSFLLGESRTTGWLSYFPLAMLFKTPLATLLAMFGALGLAIIRLISPRLSALTPPPLPGETAAAPAPRLDLWAILCLTVPPAIYALAAITSNLNLGLRHILPVYPFIFIGIGVMVAVALKLLPKLSRFVVAGLVILLAAESLPSWPNYLPFFNTPSRMVGPLKLLADSNLDWGQDLKALGEWYQKHNDRPLFLCYFGSVDPAYYKLKYTNLTGGWMMQPQVPLSDVRGTGYLAISATNLQGVYLPSDEYAKFRSIKPVEVINGTIYIYDYPPAK
ncbi:phospholipid carrier-dependent glycosyltransferase [soil metagenome]